MEHNGATAEGEWTSLSGMYTNEEAHFMSQLLGDSSSNFNILPCSQFDLIDNSSIGIFWPDNNNYNNVESLSTSMNISGFNECSFSDVGNSDLYQFSQESYHYFNGSDHGPTLTNNTSNNSSASMEICIGDLANNAAAAYLVDDVHGSNQEVSSDDHESSQEKPKGNIDMAVAPQLSAEISTKRTRSNGNAPKSKRNVRSKKSQKHEAISGNDQKENNAGLIRPASGSFCSDDDSNASPEAVSSRGTETLNLGGKTRASRGAATDPQSLYARKRRERINERLRILQNLVPNGTKVDISTMLEEAVQYVKFLQLQIKLLSSDDLWMYAPIAYNGKDIGLDLNIISPK